MVDGIVTVDEQGLIESFNRSARRLFGYSEPEMIGQPLGLIVQADDRSDVSPSGSSGRSGQDTAVGPVGTVGRRKDGSSFPIEVETSQMQVGERTMEIDSIRDVSERQAYRDALGHQALHDALTGLPNRILFGDRISQAIVRAHRSGEPCGVLVIDSGWLQTGQRHVRA